MSEYHWEVSQIWQRSFKKYQERIEKLIKMDYVPIGKPNEFERFVPREFILKGYVVPVLIEDIDLYVPIEKLLPMIEKPEYKMMIIDPIPITSCQKDQVFWIRRGDFHIISKINSSRDNHIQIVDKSKDIEKSQELNLRDFISEQTKSLKESFDKLNNNLTTFIQTSSQKPKQKKHT